MWQKNSDSFRATIFLLILLHNHNRFALGLPIWCSALAHKVGDKVVPTRLVDYDGRRLRQYDKTYTITELIGNRAVLCAKRNGKNVVWAAMNTSDIKKV